MAQVDTMTFRIAVEDHDRAIALFTDILQYQREHPELYYYSRSRTFFRPADDNPDHELWFFIDEYDDRDKYWESLMSALQSDPRSAENQRAWADIVLPPLPKGHEVWTEIDPLRVEYEGR